MRQRMKKANHPVVKQSASLAFAILLLAVLLGGSGFAQDLSGNPEKGTGSQTTSTTYDFYTGLPLTGTDINGNVSSISYTNNSLGTVDPFGRPGTTYSPYVTIGGVSKRQIVKTYYEDSNLRTRVESDLFNEGDALVKVRATSDQMGRPILNEKNENGSSSYSIFSNTVYDVQNRVVLSSNPRRSASATTDGWTRVTKDVLGRVTESATFAGASQPPTSGTNSNWTGSATSAYTYNATTVTDQAGKVRRSITNALGQLVEVDEPNSSGQLDVSGAAVQPTTYYYDVLGNLTQVTQGGQNRYFYYTSLSRLREANNPESGTISYAYDNNGNLTSKSQVRSGTANVLTSYTYDALNRVTQRSYSTPNGTPTNYQATPTVTYTYDNKTYAKGKLTKVSSSISATEYTSFDSLGRVTAHKQTTDGHDYTTAYTYNLSGALVEETYPSTRKVRNTLDTNGDLAEVESKKNSSSAYWSYANSFSYNAAGAMTAVRLGNGLWESTAFNARLQPTQIALGNTSGATNLLKLNYSYGTTQNNGNVQSQTITVPSLSQPFIQSYTYDSLNRLLSATETNNSAQTWKQTFIYDRYGNRNFDEANTTTLTKSCGTSPSFTVCTPDRKKENPSVNTANNRLNTSDDYAYDLAGNTTADADSQSYIYDGENKMVQASNGTGALGYYYYDGDGQRVKKLVPNGETTVFVYDASGKMVAEYSTVSNPTPQVSYLTSDNLGTPRINTNTNGGVISRHDYRPFGEEIVSSQRTAGVGYQSDEIRKQFTGYERDDESGLDFAQARYYEKSLGRFTTPDPLTVFTAQLNPKKWNKYAYVSNNPLKLVDPSGLYEFDKSVTEDQRDKFRDGLKLARKNLEKIKTEFGKDSSQYLDARRGLAIYKNEGDKGVIVKVGDIKSGAGAEVAPKKDANGNIAVTFNSTFFSTDKAEFEKSGVRDFQSLVGHEGSHIDDVATGKGPTMSTYDREYTGLFVQSVLLQVEYGSEQGRNVIMGNNSLPLWDPANWGTQSLGPAGEQFGLDIRSYAGEYHRVDAINTVLAVPKSEGGLYGVTTTNPNGLPASQKKKDD
jgi:RHS repeat-associated protein